MARRVLHARNTLQPLALINENSRLMFFIVLAFLAIPVSSVLYGDEQFGDIAGGRFWAFHSEGVSVVNPESCSVERTFTTDDEGNVLPSSWFDGIYMESQDGGAYVLINSGVTRFDGHENLEGGAGEVLVFSTLTADYDNPVKSKVTIGGRPVHSYGVYTRDEVRFNLFGSFFTCHSSFRPNTH